MWLGTAVFLAGLSLPLFRARFEPPGGNEVLSGHQFNAFSFQATGFQFAKAAPSSRIWALIFVMLVVLGTRTALYLAKRWKGESLNEPATKAMNGLVTVAKSAQAITGSIVALGWLILLSAAILLSYTPIVQVALPVNGAKGILPSFEHPLSPGPTIETPYFTMSLAMGMAFLIAGISLCLFSVGKIAGAACILYIVAAIILVIVQHIFHNIIVDDVLHAVRTFLFASD
jgi:hypothetical protein